MTWKTSIHMKYGRAHGRSNITVHNRDMRQMISNINYQREPRICEKVEATGAHSHKTTRLQWNSWCMGICLLNPFYSPHTCGAWLYSARYRTAPGWTGTGGGGVEFKPHLCLLLFLPLSFHLDDWDNTTWVNTVTDMTLSQDAGTRGLGFQ